jgi:hypothetical protein
MRTSPEQVVREMGEQVERAFRRSQEGPRDAR